MRRLRLLLLTAAALAACEMPTEVVAPEPEWHPPAFDLAPAFNLASDPALVGHWGLDDGSGPVAADASGNSNIGTLMNGPSWIPGNSGTALAFDGVDDHVLVPDDDALDLAGDFTISLWVKWTEYNSDADILRKGSVRTAKTHYKIEMGQNRIRVRLMGRRRQTVLTDTQASRNDGIWHHIAVTRAGSASRLYIDGSLIVTNNKQAGDLSNSANLAFGSKDTGDDDFFNGSLDDIRLYSRALTEQEINELSKSGDETPPTVPQDVAADPVDAFSIQMTWSESSDPESGVSLYRIYRDNVLVGQSVIPAFIDEGLTEETTYVYEVSAVNGAGLESARGGPVEAVTPDYEEDESPPTIPQNVAAEPLDPFNTRVTWAESSDPESGVSSYRVYRDNVFVGQTVVPPLIDGGLSPETTYLYEVSAVNGEDLESARGGPAEATMPPDEGGSGGNGGIVGRWGLDDGSGPVAADASGNGNFGTLMNGPTWVPGRSGTALAFDGIDDHVLVLHDEALNLVGDFTISVWLRWTESNSDADILRKGSAGTAATHFKIELRDNRIRVKLRGAGKSTFLWDDLSSRNDGNWHHIAVTRAGASRLYVDGTLIDASSTDVGDLSNSANLAFGSKDTGDDDFFNGSLDDIRFYSRALSEQEINELVVSVPR